MDYALSAAFVGPVMLDSITRAKSGRTYDCEVQVRCTSVSPLLSQAR